MNGVILDSAHCYLIDIENVTQAPRTHILYHDASTKQVIGCTKIGNNVFIGANSTITRDIPDNNVVAGSTEKIVETPVITTPVAGMEEMLGKNNDYGLLQKYRKSLYMLYVNIKEMLQN